MSTASIKTKYGNTVEVSDEFGLPIALRVEDDEGKCRTVVLSEEDATSIARTLDAFVTISTRTARP